MDSQRPTSPSDGWSFGRKRHTGFRRTWWAPVALATAILLITLSLSAVAAAQTAPSISSDKEDYAPGETVTLTGAGWQAGEAVHIRVDDDQERTWSHDADVTADEAGGFTYQFTLPTHFVAVYTVVATGEVSGTATTSFTDGNVEVRNHSTTPAGVTATYKLERWGNTTCSGAPTETKTFSITGPGAASPAGQVSTGNSESIKLTLVSVTGGTFVKWMRDDNPPLTESGALDFAYASGTCLGVASPTQWLIFGVFAAAANQAPVAAPVSVTTNEDTPVSVQLSATDADGNPLTFAIVSNPSNGSLGSIGSVSCSGTAPKTCTANVSYTPNANFHGSDSFTYKANDGTVDSGTATVSITVSSVNDAPVAKDDSYSTAEDTSLNVLAPGVLGNDSDVDGDSLTAVRVSGPSHGTLTLNANGSFTYMPSLNFCGSDSFTYKANDGAADSNEATVTIDVKCVNDAPVVNLSGDASVNEGETKTYSFTTSDPDSSSFTLDSVSCGTGGTQVGPTTFASSTGAGSFDCKFPDGPASSTVSVQVSDGDGGSDSDSISVTVANVDPTVTVAGDATADEGQTKTYTFTTTDPGDEVFTLDSVSCGTGGTQVGPTTFASSTGAGSFDCKFPDGPASSTVSVQVSDGDGGSDSDSISVTVANVAPEITSAAFNAAAVSCANNAVTLAVAFTDPGADTWLATITWGDGSPAESLSVTPGTFTATHTYALAGVYTANVVVADDDGGSDSASASITVNYTIVGDGFLPPINNTGHGQNPSIFKYGSTIPVKIKVQDCDGSYASNLAPKVYVQKVTNNVPDGGEIEPYSTSAADTGNTMRFTGAPDYQYIFNLATKQFSNDPTSTWKLMVRIAGTSQEISTVIGLKK